MVRLQSWRKLQGAHALLAACRAKSVDCRAVHFAIRQKSASNPHSVYRNKVREWRLPTLCFTQLSKNARTAAHEARTAAPFVLPPRKRARGGPTLGAVTLGCNENGLVFPGADHAPAASNRVGALTTREAIAGAVVDDAGEPDLRTKRRPRFSGTLSRLVRRDLADLWTVKANCSIDWEVGNRGLGQRYVPIELLQDESPRQHAGIQVRQPPGTCGRGTPFVSHARHRPEIQIQEIAFSLEYPVRLRRPMNDFN